MQLSEDCENFMVEQIIGYDRDIIQLVDNPIVILDSDVLVYTAASICEKKTRRLREDGTFEDRVFIHNESRGYEVIDNHIRSMEEKLRPEIIKCVLSNPDEKTNYRTHVTDSVKIYKANRKDRKRPKYYEHMRSYFINSYESHICDKGEADDYIGKILYKDYESAISKLEELKEYDKCKIVAASTDKDFNQFAGYVWNFDKHELSYSDPFGYLVYEHGSKKPITGRGFIYFCAQMIAGDSADNIIGIRGYGSKKAYDELFEIKTMRDAWRKVIKLYRDKNRADTEILAHATLLWITHEEGRLLPHSNLIEDML